MEVIHLTGYDIQYLFLSNSERSYIVNLGILGIYSHIVIWLYSDNSYINIAIYFYSDILMQLILHSYSHIKKSQKVTKKTYRCIKTYILWMEIFPLGWLKHVETLSTGAGFRNHPQQEHIFVISKLKIYSHIVS